MGWLSLAIWLPIATAVLLLLMPRNAAWVRGVGLVGALLGLAVTLPLYFGFQTGTADMQFVEHVRWIERWHVYYYLGIDGISLWFIILTAVINLLVIIAGWHAADACIKEYMAAFLALSGLMIGVFSALDGLLFYIFFEATLIPMYIIIGVWGGKNRIYASFKFFLYTLLGSLLSLVAIVYLYRASGGSFNIQVWHKTPLSLTAQTLVFFAMFAAFAVKVPMWPVHTWLPDVHVEAPTGGSVVLAAIMLKLGAYGFVRLSMPIAPDAAREWAWLMIALSLIAIVYIGFVALIQKDMKKLVAYSSVAHMGFVTLGFFLFSDLGISGGLVQMISHGFVSGAMFLCIGVLYERTHSREIADYGGVVQVMPRFAALALLFFMANCGLPGTSGFVGEWMVILAAIKYQFWIGVAAASTLVLGAAYTLWMFKRVYFGAAVSETVKALRDIQTREFLVLAVFAVMVLGAGIYPKLLTDVMDASVQHLLGQITSSKL